MEYISDVRRNQSSMDDVVPGTSGYHGKDRRTIDEGQHRRQAMNADEHANEMIWEAEEARARMLDPRDKDHDSNNFGQSLAFHKHGYDAKSFDVNREFVHSAMVDENYLLVATHVDESTQRKIEKGDYVDFTRLLPRDKILEEEEEAMQMVVKNGKTFWKPVNSWDVDNSGGISSINKWEQAFRVFRWFKFTLKPPNRITGDKLRLAILDTSFWTFWLKFGHKGP